MHPHKTTRDINTLNQIVSAEGWAIFLTPNESTDEKPSRYQLQRSDEMEVFTDDGEAWAHVLHCACERSIVHLDALALLRDHAHIELARLLATASAHQRLQLADAGIWTDPGICA